MKKVMILAAAAVAAVGCTKISYETEQAPVMPDVTAPVVFGAQTNVDVQSKVTQMEDGYVLGVYAFKNATVPTSNGASAADNALWVAGKKNVQYTWDNVNSVFSEEGTSTLFWPAKGESTQLSFACYSPYSASAVSDYTLTQDLSNQSAAPDYAFAWAKAEGVERPDPVSAHELTFDYKVAKLSLSIIADGTTIGSGTGIKMQEGGRGAGVVSVKVYGGGSDGFYKTYSLDLLTGTPSGTTNLTQGAPMTLKGVNQVGAAGKPSTLAYVDAIGYICPSDDANLKSGGIVVAIEYNDGVSTQIYTAELKNGTGSLSGDAAFENGIVAAKNYKYTLKLGKTGITFTGQVNDWTDVEGGEVDLQ